MNEKRHSAPDGPEVGLNQEPSEGGQAAVEPETLEDLKQALAAEKEKAEQYLASWQRTQADFINYRRRTEQEKEELANFSQADLMKGLFPILDDLGRALNSAPAGTKTQAWAEGVKLIERKLMAFLESQGLTPIKSLAEPFDPNFHEAVLYVEGEEGKVVEEVQKGYMLRGRVLRPAMVKVGKGIPPVDEENKEKEAQSS